MHFGILPEEMHEKLLIMFALIDVREDEYVVESTTTMSDQRLFFFIENIWMWVVDNSIPIEHYKRIDERIKIKIIERHGNKKIKTNES
jgi:hypothetical protein